MFLAILAVSMFAQEQPKAVQIDEFGRIPCDDLGSRASNLVQNVSETPGSRALVISYPGNHGQSLVLQQFRQILASFEFAKLEDRVEFVIGERGGDAKVEFWKVPQGAKEPGYNGQRWKLPTQDLTKPFVFDAEDENGECPTFVLRKFAELLSNNPGSRANIVVVRGGRYAFPARGFADQWVVDLSNKFGISRKRIRIFYGKSSGNLTYAEFWFVPSKRN
jgi:hypothetical protein